MPGAEYGNGRTVLLAEDDLEVCDYLRLALKCQGYSVEVAHNGEDLLAQFRDFRAPLSAVLLDMTMPQKDGMDTLKEIRRLDREVPVIMISGATSPRSVVEAMKSGANDFLAKPVKPEDLRRALKPMAQAKQGVNGSDNHHAAAAARYFFASVSPKMQDLHATLESIGWSEAPVLIHGETGAGKEVFARELHARSPRAKRPILKLNCAALPSELVESELFGYERGAFTGAFQRKPGMFELADGGTILLDEIGDMDFKLQAKLLQVLQDHEFHRLGGKETISVDVRVIAATHRDLEKAIAEGSFREDLYYRLNVIGLRVPPLRERKEDLVNLAAFLVRKHNAPGSPAPEIPPVLQQAFLEYDWPGNIRELENIIRRFLVLRDTRLIVQGLRSRLPLKPAGPPAPADCAPELPLPAPLPLPANGNGTGVHHPPDPPQNGTPLLAQVAKAKKEAERSVILSALKTTNWNRRQASAMLQVDYKVLLYKMKVLAIKKEKAPEAR